MNDKLESYINCVKHLPATPTVLVKLIELFQEPESKIYEIAELIHQDTGLTDEILRHSNCAYFVRSEPIVDVFDAIMHLGFYEIYKAALAKLGPDILCVSDGPGNYDFEKLWHHSALTAMSASVIARRVGENQDHAFTSGLLHDLGKIILASASPESYAELIVEHREQGAALQTAETMLFGFGHAQVGARLLEKWKLPEEITIPVLTHHQTAWEPAMERPCAVVALANILAHTVAAIIPGEQHDPPVAESALAVLHLQQSDLPPLLKAIRNEITRMSALLDAVN